MRFKATIMDDNTLKRTVTRISHEILEKNMDIDNIVLIGIKTRGVPLAKMISESIEQFEGRVVPFGTLDITLYRDDLSSLNEKPVLNATDIQFSVVQKTIILVDDVLYTGRTVRAAIDAIVEIGRPKSIQLAVLVDRGHRELPFRADFVGKNVPTSKNEIVSVSLQDTDGKNCVELFSID